MRKSFFALLFLAFCPLVITQQGATPITPAPASQPQAVPSQIPSLPSDAATSNAEKPRVFITDSQSWEMMGSAGGANGSFAAESHGGARPQTAEIIKTFGQRCPDVIVNNKQEVADYIVVLDHEGGKGYLRHKDKVAVFQHVSGDAVVSHSTLSLGGSVEDACKGIESDWKINAGKLLAAKEKSSADSPEPSAPALKSSMQPQPMTQATVAISSTPPGADVEVDGAFVGNTPSTIDVASGSHEITVKKTGFADWTRKLNVTGGNIHLDAELAPAAPPAPSPAPAQSPAPPPQ